MVGEKNDKKPLTYAIHKVFGPGPRTNLPVNEIVFMYCRNTAGTASCLYENDNILRFSRNTGNVVVDGRRYTVPIVRGLRTGFETAVVIFGPNSDNRDNQPGNLGNRAIYYTVLLVLLRRSPNGAAVAAAVASVGGKRRLPGRSPGPDGRRRPGDSVFREYVARPSHTFLLTPDARAHKHRRRRRLVLSRKEFRGERRLLPDVTHVPATSRLPP